MCLQKDCPTKFETRWLQEIPFSKEFTDNYCALRFLYESIMQTQTQFRQLLRIHIIDHVGPFSDKHKF